LFEPLGELFERSEKEKNSEDASEVGGRSPSRSKNERIMDKMMRSISAGRRSTKRINGLGGREWREGV
jgi:hypothetical protein